jgi:PadR family transcriptional regulator PadR
MHDLTGFQRDLLYVIAGFDVPHGLALKDELEDYYEKEIQHGRLYPNLDTLVEKGLVEKGTIDRRTNSYELTRRAKREIESREEWEAQYVSTWTPTCSFLTTLLGDDENEPTANTSHN